MRAQEVFQTRAGHGYWRIKTRQRKQDTYSVENRQKNELTGREVNHSREVPEPRGGRNQGRGIKTQRGEGKQNKPPQEKELFFSKVTRWMDANKTKANRGEKPITLKKGNAYSG